VVRRPAQALERLRPTDPDVRGRFLLYPHYRPTV